MFPLVSVAGKDLGIKNSVHPAPKLSSVLDNQKQVVTIVQNSTEVGQCECPGSRGTKATERFRLSYNLAEPGYAFPMGESEIPVVSPNTSQILRSNVGQVYSDPSPC